MKIAGKVLEGMTCIRLDATVTTASSDKELAASNFKGFPSFNFGISSPWLAASLAAARPCPGARVRLGHQPTPGRDLTTTEQPDATR